MVLIATVSMLHADLVIQQDDSVVINAWLYNQMNTGHCTTLRVHNTQGRVSNASAIVNDLVGLLIMYCDDNGVWWFIAQCMLVVMLYIQQFVDSAHLIVGE